MSKKTKPKKLTPAEYVKRDGFYCPACSSNRVGAFGDPYPSGRKFFAECRCEACGARWDEEYSLTGYTLLRPPWAERGDEEIRTLTT